MQEMNWISVDEAMPIEHDSIFAKWYGTNNWNRSMWRKTSDNVLVTALYDDGTKIVDKICTHDGEWYKHATIFTAINCKVTHWMPLPDPA